MPCSAATGWGGLAAKAGRTLATRATATTKDETACRPKLFSLHVNRLTIVPDINDEALTASVTFVVELERTEHGLEFESAQSRFDIGRLQGLLALHRFRPDLDRRVGIEGVSIG